MHVIICQTVTVKRKSSSTHRQHECTCFQIVGNYHKKKNLHVLVKLHLVEHSVKQTHKKQHIENRNNIKFSQHPSIFCGLCGSGS